MEISRLMSGRVRIKKSLIRATNQIPAARSGKWVNARLRPANGHRASRNAQSGCGQARRMQDLGQTAEIRKARRKAETVDAVDHRAVSIDHFGGRDLRVCGDAIQVFAIIAHCDFLDRSQRDIGIGHCKSRRLSRGFSFGILQQHRGVSKRYFLQMSGGVVGELLSNHRRAGERKIIDLRSKGYQPRMGTVALCLSRNEAARLHDDIDIFSQSCDMSKGKACESGHRLHHEGVSFEPDPAELILRPIGYVRSGKSVKFAARHQPDESAEETCVLELLPQEELRRGLQDLSGFSRIWLIWWFHRNDTWRSLVLPPRGPAHRRGVFATRSPHRPNAIGMTPVKLLEIDGFHLHLGPCDLVDGTPVFDIKPYIPAYDAFPEESSGWLAEADAWAQREPQYRVEYEPLAQVQAKWLRDEWGIDFLETAEAILSRDPSPHRTRRIRRKSADECEMGCGAWRLRFHCEKDRVVIHRLRPGFPLESLLQYDQGEVPDREAQSAFLACWPES